MIQKMYSEKSISCTLISFILYVKPVSSHILQVMNLFNLWIVFSIFNFCIKDQVFVYVCVCICFSHKIQKVRDTPFFHFFFHFKIQPGFTPYQFTHKKKSSFFIAVYYSTDRHPIVHPSRLISLCTYVPFQYVPLQIQVFLYLWINFLDYTFEYQYYYIVLCYFLFWDSKYVKVILLCLFLIFITFSLDLFFQSFIPISFFWMFYWLLSMTLTKYSFGSVSLGTSYK